MSVAYGVECEVYIRGDREQIAQIPAVLEDVKPDLYDENFSEYISSAVEEALQSEQNPLLLSFDWSGFSHGDGSEIYNWCTFLTALDKQLPELEIAAGGMCIDVEYDGEGTAPFSRYSPKGESLLNPWTLFFDLPDHNMPDEDWIPYAWRHPGEIMLTATADATVRMIGAWDDEECALLRNALHAPELSAAMLAADWNVSETADGSMHIQAAGYFAFSEMLLYLPLVLADQFKAAQGENDTRLCALMRAKKQVIHVELDEYTNYQQDNSLWHFLLSSDGTGILSRFVWCGTYAFATGGYPHPLSPEWIDLQYKKLTGEDMENLTETEQFLVQNAIATFALPLYTKNSLQEDDEDDDDGEEDDEDDDDYEDEDDEEENDDKDMTAILNEEQKATLLSLIEKARKRASAMEQKQHCYIPEHFDNRFAGKTFVMKGEDFGGYEPGEIERIITGFGGKVEDKVTEKTDWLICGSAIGKPFTEALKYGTALLTPEYFEDMTR